VPPPPPWALRFRSEDLDEVRAFASGVDIPHVRVVKQPGSLAFDFYSVRGSDVAVASKISSAQTVRGKVRQPVLHLIQPSGSVYRVGRRVLGQTSETSAIMVAPDWEFTRTSPPGMLVGIRVNQSALRTELESRRTQDSSKWALRMASLALSPAEKAKLLVAASGFIHATRPGGRSCALAHAEADVLELVAGLMLRESAVQPAGSLSLARLADLEHWIDAHHGTPITLGRLCQVAGVGERCLQKAFEHRRGMSPMRFVAERRILAAYQGLARAGEQTSVTGIALALGFQHLGRFAQMYRQLIGEAPSQTLATRRAATAAAGHATERC